MANQVLCVALNGHFSRCSKCQKARQIPLGGTLIFPRNRHGWIFRETRLGEMEFRTTKDIQSSNLGDGSCDGCCMVRFKSYEERWVFRMAMFVKTPLGRPNQGTLHQEACTRPLFQTISWFWGKLARPLAAFRNIRIFPIWLVYQPWLRPNTTF